MKYIDNFNLFELTNYMTEKEFGLCVLNGKLEAFSLIRSPPVISLVGDDSKATVAGFSGIASDSIEGLKMPTSSSSSSCKSGVRHHPTNSATTAISLKIDSAGAVKGYEDQNVSQFPCAQRRRSNSTTGGPSACRKPLRLRATSLGDLGEPSSRRLLFDLISTLDDFFPDYDFDTTKPEQFLIKDVNQLIQTVNGYLAELTEERPNFLEKLWRSIDDVINLRKCEAFSLVPDMTEDPFSDGTLWSFNYFLFNHDLKQLIYFTCVAKR